MKRKGEDLSNIDSTETKKLRDDTTPVAQQTTPAAFIAPPPQALIRQVAVLPHPVFSTIVPMVTQPQERIDTGVTTPAAHSGVAKTKKPITEYKKQKALNEKLNKAIKKGDIESVRSLIKQGAGINGIKDANYRVKHDIPLHSAIEHNQKEIAALLLELGADVNITFDGKTPLKIAIESNQKEMVSLLLKLGADVNPGVYGKTPLHIAVEKNQIEIVALLLNHNADVNPKDSSEYQPLHIAVRNNQIEIVSLLLKHKADANKSYYGKTPLHIAIENYRKEMVSLLLKHGANVNVNAKVGVDTPLHIAIKNNQTDIVALLLEHGANVNVNAKVGVDTPLHIAIKNNQTDIVALLLKHKANVNAESLDRDTTLAGLSQLDRGLPLTPPSSMPFIPTSMPSPLNMAVGTTHTDIVDLLLKNGADFSAGSVLWAQSTLCKALAHKANADLLFERGAYKNTPLAMVLREVVRHGDLDHVAAWISRGADVNAADKEGKTALHMAVFCGNNDIAALLIKNGADVNAVASKGAFGNFLASFPEKFINPLLVCLFARQGPNRRLNQGLLELLLVSGAIVTAKQIEQAKKTYPQDAGGINSVFNKSFCRVNTVTKVVQDDEKWPLSLYCGAPAKPKVVIKEQIVSINPALSCNYNHAVRWELAQSGGRAAHKIFRGGDGMPEQGVNQESPFSHLVEDVMPQIFKHLSIRDMSAFLTTASQFNHQTTRPAVLEGTPYTLKVAREDVKIIYPAKLDKASKSFTAALEASRQDNDRVK